MSELKSFGILLADFLRRVTRPWMRYAGMVESGDSRSGQAIDDIIYG
jgi:hypothetical protein